ncbi:hypothetical protein RJ641_021583 [Dillenia turbinata]|uniref:Uncharacterized protein n=1 Tax=Dillenia turbinata TaxID=194707 RepID=A0AAN8UR21_9MAGN
MTWIMGLRWQLIWQCLDDVSTFNSSRLDEKQAGYGSGHNLIRACQCMQAPFTIKSQLQDCCHAVNVCRMVRKQKTCFRHVGKHYQVLPQSPEQTALKEEEHWGRDRVLCWELRANSGIATIARSNSQSLCGREIIVNSSSQTKNGISLGCSSFSENSTLN